MSSRIVILSRLARRPEAALFVLVLGVYAYFYQAGGWNQNSRFDLVRSLVERRTTIIDAYHRNSGDMAFRGEHFYTDKAPGLSLMAVPPYAVLHAIAPLAAPDTAAYVVTLFAVALPSAMAVVALFLLAGAFAPTLSAGVRAALALAYGLGTLAFPYATLFYGHQVVASLLLMTFAILARTPSRAMLLVAGALLGWAVAVEYPAALGGAVLFIYAVVTIRPRRRVLWIVLGGIVPAVVLAVYHTIAFGGPFTLPYVFDTQKDRHQGFFMGLGAPDPHALGSLLASSYRGLFFSAPWLLLGVAGMAFAIARRRTRAEGLVCAAVLVLYLWLASSLVDWHGGWALGPRHLIPAIPFVAVAAAALPRRRIVLAAGAALAALSCALMLVGTAVKPEVYVKIMRPFHDFLFPLFARGELAVSAQSIDASQPAAQGRFAWNLGQLLGLRGVASLIPLGVFVALAAGWLINNSVRRRPGAPSATAAS